MGNENVVRNGGLHAVARGTARNAVEYGVVSVRIHAINAVSSLHREVAVVARLGHHDVEEVFGEGELDWPLGSLAELHVGSIFRGSGSSPALSTFVQVGVGSTVLGVDEVLVSCSLRGLPHLGCTVTIRRTH